MATTTTDFEARKNRRIEVAAMPGTMVFQPKAQMSYGLTAYLRQIDRSAFALQNQIFQPGKDKNVIAKATEIVDNFNKVARETAISLSELAGIKFRDPEVRGAKPKKAPDKAAETAK